MKRLLVKLAKRLPGIRDLVAERDELRADLAAEKALRRRLEEEVEIEQQRLAAEQRRTEAEAAEAQRLQEELTDLQAQLDATRADLEAATKRRGTERTVQRIAKLKGQRQALAKRLETVQQEAGEARKRAQGLKEQLGAERTKVTDLRGKLEGERRRVADLQAGIAKGRRRVETLKSAVDRTGTKANALQSDLEKERAAKQALRQKILDRGWKPGYARKPNYVATRERFLEHCIELGKLPVDGSVLDVGCGIGGVAEQLAKYLSDDGRYHGFDVLPEAIQVANENIAPAHPNFSFALADVWNSKYNPEGTYKPEDYRFPFDDDSFDLVILRSVFTHMLPHEIENYLAEIARVLKPGARCLITYFLLNEATLADMHEEIAEYFSHDRGIYRLSDEDVVEAAVALDEGWVLGAYASAGLEIAEPILYGSWREPDRESLDGQDLITAGKPG